MEDEFDSWLYERLRELKTDESIFGPYIKSILEGDEDTEEQIEALDGIIVELQANLDVSPLRDEILRRWNNKAQSSSSGTLINGNPSSGSQGDGDAASSHTTSLSGQLKSDKNGIASATDESLANHMDHFMKLAGLDSQSSQQQSSSASDKATSTKANKGDIGADSALRAAILSQYCANESSDEEGEEGPVSSKTRGPLDGVSKNDNAEKVLAEQREFKEKSRAEHAKKKDRDKEDRAKQKQAAQDRKEKAKKKATKGERKR